MHPFETSKIPLFIHQEVGSFVASRFAVYEGEHVLLQLSKIIDKLERSETMNAHDDYFTTIAFHERRHFLDFIENPFAESLILNTARKWKAVKDINKLLADNNSTLKLPLARHMNDLAQSLGPGHVTDLLEIDLSHNFYFTPKRERKKVLDKEQQNSFLIMRADRMPGIPCFTTEDSVIPIDLCSVLEGSSILSQLTFILSGRGTNAARSFWHMIEQRASTSGNSEYVSCLKSLESIFGKDSLYDVYTLEAFRKIFRFALEGLLVEFSKPFSEKEDSSIIFNRFANLVYNIKNEGTGSFLSNPDKYIAEFSKQNYPWMHGKLDQHKSFLSQFINSPEFYDGREVFGDTLFAALKAMLDYNLKGLHQDKDIADQHFDTLLSQDDTSDIIQPPIQIYRLDQGNVYSIEIISDEDIKNGLWFTVFVLDVLADQCLYSNRVLCPLSGIRCGCEMAEKNKKVDLTKCSDNCGVREIASCLNII